ncbi:Ecm3 [Kluyveromyces lactis]|nr:Ecm3 [Kluyveromyces lactis]
MGLTVGEAIWASVKPIIKIYMIIATGFGLAKGNILSVAATRTCSDIVLTVLLPSLSFNKIVSSIDYRDAKDVGIICLTAVMIFGTGLFFALVVRKVLPVPKKWRGGILAGGTFPNISDLPIAILQTMDQGHLFTEEEADKGIASVIIFLAMFMICIFNLGGFRLIEMDFEYADEENASIQTPLEPPAQSNASQFHLQTDSQSFCSKENDRTVNSINSHEAVTSPIQLAEDNVISRRLTNATAASAQSLSSSLRSIDLRSMPPENVHDLIKEYSNVDQYGARRNSVTSTIKPETEDSDQVPLRKELTNLKRIVTSDATVTGQDIKESANILPSKVRNIPGMSILLFFLKNFLRPCSMAVFLALLIAFVPWLKALFVTTSNGPYIHPAPDGQPALNFIMDYTGYLGNASVPFGLMLLGATLGRLKIKKLYPGFWKSAAILVILRLCIMPIFGVLWCDRLVKAGWLNWQDDSMLLLVIVIDWGLPTMTTIIFFTASFTPPDSEDTTQMDCVAFFLILQYPVLIISLPFLITYFLLVQMKV